MEEKISPGATVKRWRRLLIALAWIVSLVALYYGITDWRAAQAWGSYRRDYEAHVAPLDYRAFIPKPIADADNFAATPFVRSWFNNPGTNLFYDKDAYAKANRKLTTPVKKIPGRKFEDLIAWQEAFAGGREAKGDITVDQHEAARAVLSALRDDEPVLAELASASSRPGSCYPVDFTWDNPWATRLPHLRRVKETCLRLKLRASAELELGQAQNALDDIKLVLFMADSLKNEPFLISYLVRIAGVQVAVSAIWEGLQLHAWNDAQLKDLQSRLEPYDFLADLQWPLHSERAVGVLTVDLLTEKGAGWLVDLGVLDNSSLIPRNKPFLNVLGRIVPSGWYNLEKLNYCRAFDDMMKGVSVQPRKISPGGIVTNQYDKATIAQSVFHHHVLAALMLPSVGRIAVKAAMAQTATDEAATACALERYRLDAGHYPQTLAGLSPRFMAEAPHDIIDGGPLLYRLESGGKFVLYSVGWNEKDDGGVPGTSLLDDWVW